MHPIPYSLLCQLRASRLRCAAEDLKPVADGSEGQQALAGVAERAATGKALYSKFLAIGLFRLLELVGVKDPKGLEGLVKSINLRPELVNRDLLTYKVRRGFRALGLGPYLSHTPLQPSGWS